MSEELVEPAPVTRHIQFQEGGVFQIEGCDTLVYCEKVTPRTAYVIVLPDQSENERRPLQFIAGRTKPVQVSSCHAAKLMLLTDLSRTNRDWVTDLPNLRTKEATAGPDLEPAAPKPQAKSRAKAKAPKASQPAEPVGSPARTAETAGEAAPGAPTEEPVDSPVDPEPVTPPARSRNGKAATGCPRLRPETVIRLTSAPHVVTGNEGQSLVLWYQLQKDHGDIDVTYAHLTTAITERHPSAERNDNPPDTGIYSGKELASFVVRNAFKRGLATVDGQTTAPEVVPA